MPADSSEAVGGCRQLPGRHGRGQIGKAQRRTGPEGVVLYVHFGGQEDAVGRLCRSHVLKELWSESVLGQLTNQFHGI